MRITWVTRSFLDYRIPIYEALDGLCGNQLTVIYNAEVVPKNCQFKLKAMLNERAIGLEGELRIGGKKVDNASFANSGLRIPIQKGLIAEIKKTKPQLILSDGFFQWTYAAYWFRLFKRTPHIMLYERTKHTERNTPIWRTKFRKYLLPLINMIGCNGIETYNYLKDCLKVDEGKLFIGNMAADNQWLTRRVNEIKTQVTPKKISCHSFLYIGQLIPRKGLIELVNAWNIFSKKKSDVELIIVGAGPHDNLLKEIIRDNNIESINFVGKVPYENVPNYYAKSDVFVIPTLEDNWSLVVPEAMSCALPVLTSKYNGCWPELITQDNGWVFDPLNKSNFIETLEEAYKNKDNWPAMGVASLELIGNYTPAIIVEKIYNSINKVISDVKYN